MIKPGSTFGKYEIIRQIGKGGMAVVFEARDTTLNRHVALKVLPPEFSHDEERSSRFRKEVLAVAALEHPSVVTIYEVNEVDGLSYFSMSLAPQGNLKERIKEKSLTPAECLRICKHIASALLHAHSMAIIHRDIKPENILFTKEQVPVLADFGIAKLVTADTNLTSQGQSLGTPYYMSPEQAQAQQDIDHRSDLYSLAVVLYEMLTGTPPYNANTALGIALMHVSDPLPKLPAQLSMFQPFVDKAMAKDPDNRFQDSVQMIQALDELIGKVKTLDDGHDANRPLRHRQITTPNPESRQPIPPQHSSQQQTAVRKPFQEDASKAPAAKAEQQDEAGSKKADARPSSSGERKKPSFVNPVEERRRRRDTHFDLMAITPTSMEAYDKDKATGEDQAADKAGDKDAEQAADQAREKAVDKAKDKTPEKSQKKAASPDSKKAESAKPVKKKQVRAKATPTPKKAPAKPAAEPPKQKAPEKPAAEPPKQKAPDSKPSPDKVEQQKPEQPEKAATPSPSKSAASNRADPETVRKSTASTRPVKPMPEKPVRPTAANETRPRQTEPGSYKTVAGGQQRPELGETVISKRRVRKESLKPVSRLQAEAAERSESASSGGLGGTLKKPVVWGSAAAALVAVVIIIVLSMGDSADDVPVDQPVAVNNTSSDTTQTATETADDSDIFAQFNDEIEQQQDEPSQSDSDAVVDSTGNTDPDYDSIDAQLESSLVQTSQNHADQQSQDNATDDFFSTDTDRDSVIDTTLNDPVVVSESDAVTDDDGFVDAPDPVTEVVLTNEDTAVLQQLEVDRLLTQAGEHLASNRLTRPAGRNAVESFQQVLSLDPENSAARDGLARVSTRLLSLARQRLLDSGDKAASRALLNRAVAISGESAESRRLAIEIDEYSSPDEVLQPQIVSVSPGRRFSDLLSSGFNGPQMVEVSAGNFVLGASVGAASNQPPYPVTFSQNFAISAHEITRNEFAQFIDKSGYETDAENRVGCTYWVFGWTSRPGKTWENPGFDQGAAHPVVCVTYNDAVAYTRWLSSETGERYQLPTEAQWEYAARLGVTARDITLENICTKSNVADLSLVRQHKTRQDSDHIFQCDDQYGSTAAVGSFDDNPLGISDMLGNVAEWVNDCWTSDYSNARNDGSAVSTDGCTEGVVRGGSWIELPSNTSLVSRVRRARSEPINHIGFRVVRINP